jgi:hypothetical protein
MARRHREVTKFVGDQRGPRLADRGRCEDVCNFSILVPHRMMRLADGMVVPDKGFEPLTIALQMRRSTN